MAKGKHIVDRQAPLALDFVPGANGVYVPKLHRSNIDCGGTAVGPGELVEIVLSLDEVFHLRLSSSIDKLEFWRVNGGADFFDSSKGAI